MKINWNDLSKYRNQLYGISMLWIVVFHVWEKFQEKMSFDWTLSYIVKHGNLGVDVFLFLSGIFMYYAIQKYINEDGSIRVIGFYKKRLLKVLRVYLLFCIPFFIMKYFILDFDISAFIRQVFFCKKNVSSFWFLLAISICYLLYPALYQCMRKKSCVIGIILLYILGLFLLCTWQNKFYMRYEILLTRIPVFFVLECIPGYGLYQKLFSRLHGSMLAVCGVFFLLLLMKYFEETKLFQFLGFLGTFTLETYVFHVAYRMILFEHMKLKIESYTEILIFLIFYTVSSFALAYLLSRGLNRVKLKH